ncbi:hypothetical protein AB1207_03305 [Kineococcus endophyticus]|uniref:Uncharacterized protein n=1 Tax=Kineococcus endophyticus TaxID=1181883 RepID=A0ABV3P2C7_9ACTN
MPSVTRTTMAVGILTPLLLLAGGQLHETSVRDASAPPVPADCSVTALYSHGTDAAGLRGPDAVRADLARRADALRADAGRADAAGARDLRAQADAARALSRPGADSDTAPGSLRLTAQDDQGRVVAEARYGLAGQVFVEPTAADGYVLQSFTYSLEPPAGRGSCTNGGS